MAMTLGSAAVCGVAADAVAGADEAVRDAAEEGAAEEAAVATDGAGAKGAEPCAGAAVASLVGAGDSTMGGLDGSAAGPGDWVSGPLAHPAASRQAPSMARRDMSAAHRRPARFGLALADGSVPSLAVATGSWCCCRRS
jgi:hypothetical protein